MAAGKSAGGQAMWGYVAAAIGFLLSFLAIGVAVLLAVWKK